MDMKRTLQTIGMLFVSLISLSGMANPKASYAKTFYVALNGDNANVGSEVNPVRSIKKGMSLMKKGDTLFIKSGTYHESINSNWQAIPTGTSWNDAPIISNFPGDTVVLKVSHGSEAINLAHPYIQYVIFNGLIVDAPNTEFGISTTNGAHHVRFKKMEIKNAKGSGIISTPGSKPAPANTFLEFINCVVHHNGSSNLDHGFYIATSRNVVKHSEIHHNSGFGVIAYHSGSVRRAEHNVFMGNMIYSNSTKSATSSGILLSSGDGNSAFNNIVYSNPAGIRVHNNNPTNSKVYNNTIYNNGVGIEVTSRSRSAMLKNNIVYKNSNNLIDNGSATERAGNLMINPNFLDEKNGDFRLQKGSLAVDQGVELVEVSHDFSQATRRPQGESFDIGAYEFIEGEAEVDTTPPDTPVRLHFIEQ